MSHTEWTLPQLPAGLNKGKAEGKRKKVQRIPGTDFRGKHCTVPDEVVAAIKWLHSQGFPIAVINRMIYPGHADNYVYSVVMGIIRRHVEPKAPIWINEAMWHQRWRSPTVKENPDDLP